MSYAGSGEPILGHLGDPRLPARFWAKVFVDETTDCWDWTGALNSRGYGAFGVEGRSTSTHRITYEVFVGPIPNDRQIDHLCRNKACCNPAHLEAVTAKVNMQRGRAVLTECVNGHPLVGENLTFHGTRGTRICIACRRQRSRDARKRQDAAA